MLNQVLRYTTVLSQLQRSEGGQLLEVGSGSRGIAGYLGSGWNITACDISFDDYGAPHVGDGRGVTRVIGSAHKLPFEADSFDAVIALDLLEHIPPDDRAQVMSELRRVTRELLVVGCPCGLAAEKADRDLAAFYARRSRRPPGWLVEHLEHGLPRTGNLMSGVQPTDDVRLISNAGCRLHLRVLQGEETWPLNVVLLWAGSALGAMMRKGGLPGIAAHRCARALADARRRPAYRQIVVIKPERP